MKIIEDQSIALDKKNALMKKLLDKKKLVEFALNSIGALMINQNARNRKTILNRQPKNKLIINPNFEPSKKRH